MQQLTNSITRMLQEMNTQTTVIVDDTPVTPLYKQEPDRGIIIVHAGVEPQDEHLRLMEILAEKHPTVMLVAAQDVHKVQDIAPLAPVIELTPVPLPKLEEIKYKKLQSPFESVQQRHPAYRRRRH